MVGNDTDCPSLQQLVDADRWQRLQDHFAEVLGIPIRTVTPARALAVTPSWPPTLSADSILRYFKVGEELEQLVPAEPSAEHTTSLTTDLGATYSAVPVRLTSGYIVGYFVVGPMVVGKREDEQQFRDRMKRQGLEADAMWGALLSLRLCTFTAIRSMLNLMEDVGTALVQFAYQARRLEALVPSSAKVDQAMVTYYTDRILHSLLEAATLTTHAEGGSVMMRDPLRDTLAIRVAEGLDEEVVAAGVSRGAGLAGLAMDRRQVLLVDDTTRDAEVKARMRRPDLRSSLIAPLTPERSPEPIGVLNLRSRHAERAFTAEHVEVLKRLLDLAGIALGGLRITASSSK